MSESDTAAEEVVDSEFTPITSQEQLDKIMGSRIDGVKKKYANFDSLKDKAAKFDALEEASKSDQEKAVERISVLESELASERSGRLRADIAAEKGVPANVLTGNTREELEAAADSLNEWRGTQETKKKAVPARGLKSGATNSDQLLDPMERAAQAIRQMRGRE
jgi:vacuolar-type H+-ATPase subunit I/STV1